MTYSCYNCGSKLSYNSLSKPGRRDECDNCGVDIHCCLMCVNFSETASNKCLEPQAELVRDKDRSNFCDYFSLKEGLGGSGGVDKSAVFSQLDELFKK